jgi:hypothetical protein
MSSKQQYTSCLQEIMPSQQPTASITNGNWTDPYLDPAFLEVGASFVLDLDDGVLSSPLQR